MGMKLGEQKMKEGCGTWSIFLHDCRKRGVAVDMGGVK